MMDDDARVFMPTGADGCAIAVEEAVSRPGFGGDFDAETAQPIGYGDIAEVMVAVIRAIGVYD